MVSPGKTGFGRCHSISGLAMLIFLSSVSPSWAWIRGGWGLLGGLGLLAAVSGPWGPCYGYPSYGYDPYSSYYYPGYDYPPYAYAYRPASGLSVNAAPPADLSTTDNSRHDLKLVKERLTQMHEQLAFKYEDGDISKADRNAGFRYFDKIAALARSEYDANGKFLTPRQEQDLLQQVQNASPDRHIPGEPYPEATPTPAQAPTTTGPGPVSDARHDPQAINDLLLELHTLLDQKLKDGDITKPQHDAEAAYLDRIEQQAHGGALTEYEESGLVLKLHQAYYAISHNLVAH